ncbi:MAG: ATP-binding protein [Gammaproteobacteria bacterium]|nr:MAG: ATP-binding protein [Gammaproteobacteria bacterium]
MSHSIRRRLLITLLTATVVVWGITAVTSYFDIRTEVNDLFDAQLAQAAEVLMSLVGDELGEELKDEPVEETEGPFVTELEEHLTEYRYRHQIAFQIWVGRKGLIFRSAGAPLASFSNADQGFSDESIDDIPWRVITLSNPDGLIRIHVGEQREVRDDLIHQIALRQLVPMLLGLSLLAMLIWIGVARSLDPLNQIARDIAKRAPAQLHPVPSNPTPDEVRPLVDALNGLFGRLRQAFEREKRLTADAAHELRTPLAGLRTQAEVAQRASSRVERDKALRQVIEGVDRSTHLVEQLLTMARIDPEAGLQEFARTDLCEITSDVMAGLAGDAIAKDIDMSLERKCVGMVQGNADALCILVRNLIDNAIRYTPHEGLVSVSIESLEDRVVLRVVDNGPGIPPERRDAVFERFYRGHESLAPGSGLGLSIVRRIAALHDGTIALEMSVHGGVKVEVNLPRANSSERRP